MSTVIVYGSRYGTTKSYAEEMGRRSNVEVFSFKEVADLHKYDKVVHFGALLAGGVYGLKKTLTLVDSAGKQKLIVVTVGLGNPTDPKTIDYLRSEIKKVIPAKLLANTQIYHLRGGIDYEKLSLIHRLMMYMVYRKAKRSGSEENDENNQLIETYNKQVSFVDFESLDQFKM